MREEIYGELDHRPGIIPATYGQPREYGSVSGEPRECRVSVSSTWIYQSECRTDQGSGAVLPDRAQSQIGAGRFSRIQTM